MFGWLIPAIVGMLTQNLSNKQTEKANAGANAGSVGNASTAWNNAFRRMAPWLAPGAGPLGHMSVSPVGAPNYGTPYGSAGAGATSQGGGANMGIINSIIQKILGGMGGGAAAGTSSSIAPNGGANPAYRPAAEMPSSVMYGNPTQPQTGFGPAPQPSAAGGGMPPNISSTLARYLGAGAGGADGVSPSGQGAQGNFGGGVRAYA